MPVPTMTAFQSQLVIHFTQTHCCASDYSCRQRHCSRLAIQQTIVDCWKLPDVTLRWKRNAVAADVDTLQGCKLIELERPQRIAL